jgi:hypothetical protein
MERKKLLVTGCGRSGTMYASEVWKTQRLDIRHENPRPPNGSMGRDGIASWYMAVNDPDPPFGPSASQYEFDFVIHQVRHPLKVIASVAQFILRDRQSRDYIERNAPQTRLTHEEHSMPRRDRLILQAARYWYYWNLICETKAIVRIQVEQLTTSLRRLCRLVGVSYAPDVAELISTNTHGRHLYTDEDYWEICWEDISSLDVDICEKIKKLARKYGY